MGLHNIAVAVSGGGRSLANLLELERRGNARYHVSCVISSRPDCKGVTIAKDAGLEVFCHKFPLEQDPVLNQELAIFLRKHDVSWIALAGFLRPLPILASWQTRIVNIHPALLPKFGGKGMYGQHVHRAVLTAGESETGATVHFVNEKYDEGAIIAQIKVPVQKTDDDSTLASRVFSAECQLYPHALNMLVTGELPLTHGQVYMMSVQT